MSYNIPDSFMLLRHIKVIDEIIRVWLSDLNLYIYKTIEKIITNIITLILFNNTYKVRMVKFNYCFEILVFLILETRKSKRNFTIFSIVKIIRGINFKNCFKNIHFKELKCIIIHDII